MVSLSSNTVNITTCVADDLRLTYQVASIPDLPGKPMSQSKISMRSSFHVSINSSADEAQNNRLNDGERLKCASSTFWIIRLSSRSEEHTSELQSRENLVCRLLLEKKNKM